jgi:hypothetical protein
LDIPAWGGKYTEPSTILDNPRMRWKLHNTLAKIHILVRHRGEKPHSLDIPVWWGGNYTTHDTYLCLVQRRKTPSDRGRGVAIFIPGFRLEIDRGKGAPLSEQTCGDVAKLSNVYPMFLWNW